MTTAYGLSVINRHGQSRFYSYTCRESAYHDYGDFFRNGDIKQTIIRVPGKYYSTDKLNNLCAFLETNILKTSTITRVNNFTIAIEGTAPEPAAVSLVMFMLRYMAKYFVNECSIDFIISELMTRQWWRFRGIAKSRFKTALYMYLCYLDDETPTKRTFLNDSNGPASLIDCMRVDQDTLLEFIMRFPTECKANLTTIRRGSNYPFCFANDRIFKHVYSAIYPDVDLAALVKKVRSTWNTHYYTY